MDDLVGKSIGGYEILRELGRGGMGVVYKAREESLNRMVALKVLPSKLSFNQDFIKRFRREAQASAALKHPNIVPIYSSGESNGLHYFAMEYVEGEDLAARLKKKGNLDPHEALDIVSQVASALSVSHDAGILHRDIKPQNIMTDHSGIVRVMDFGLAKQMEEATSHLTKEGSFLGTIRYASPEQCESLELDGRSDIYSLGVVLYECLTGKIPYKATSSTGLIKEILMANPIPLQSMNPFFAPKLQGFVDRFLAKDPKYRFQDAEECLKAIEKIRNESLLLGPQDSITSSSVSRTRIKSGGEFSSPVAMDEEQGFLDLPFASDEPPQCSKPRFHFKRFKTTAMVVICLGILGLAGYGGLLLWDSIATSEASTSPAPLLAKSPIPPSSLQKDEFIVSKDGTEDYSSIKTAMNESSFGDTIIVKPGIYRETFSFRPGVTLRGMEAELCRLQLPANAQAIIFVKDCDSGQIDNLVFENPNGLAEKWTENLEESDCGLFIQNSSIKVENCVFQKLMRGVQITGIKSSPLISNNRFEFNWLGIRFEGGASGTADKNICNQNAEALSMAHPGTNPLLTRNECRNSTKWSGICFQRSSGGIAEDNISENNLVGIAIIDSSNAILRGNICKNNTGNGLFLGNYSGCSAELNLFENNKKWGISIEENSRQYDISNNTCRGNVNGGIRIASFPLGSILKGNLLEKNGIGLGIYANTPSPLEELNTLRGNTKAVEK